MPKKLSRNKMISKKLAKASIFKNSFIK